MGYILTPLENTSQMKLRIRGIKLCGLCFGQGAVSVSTGKVKWFNGSKGFGFIAPTKVNLLSSKLEKAKRGRAQQT